MTKRYSVKTDHQGRSYICDRKTINDLPLKTGALRDSQVAHRLNRLECIDKTLNELGKKLDRRNKQIAKLKANHNKLVEDIKKTCQMINDEGEVGKWKIQAWLEVALKEAGEIT